MDESVNLSDATNESGIIALQPITENISTTPISYKIISKPERVDLWNIESNIPQIIPSHSLLEETAGIRRQLTDFAYEKQIVNKLTTVKGTNTLGFHDFASTEDITPQQIKRVRIMNIRSKKRAKRIYRVFQLLIKIGIGIGGIYSLIDIFTCFIGVLYLGLNTVSLKTFIIWLVAEVIMALILSYILVKTGTCLAEAQIIKSKKWAKIHIIPLCFCTLILFLLISIYPLNKQLKQFNEINDTDEGTNIREHQSECYLALVRFIFIISMFFKVTVLGTDQFELLMFCKFKDEYLMKKMEEKQLPTEYRVYIQNFKNPENKPGTDPYQL